MLLLSEPKELREKILFEPVREGADKLRIISGYSAHTMVSWHISELGKRFEAPVSIDLTVGMCIRDKLFKSVHEGFKSLMRNGCENYRADFVCKYIVEGKPVHTKLYLWEKDGRPFKAFTGSANYTQPAFFGSQTEEMTECSPEKATESLDRYESLSMYCTHADIEDRIIITEKPQRLIMPGAEDEKLSPVSLQGIGVKSVNLSLLVKRTGETAPRSGLNWGQREGRDPNQAYISLPSDVAASDFFPEKGIHFSVLTDDGKTIILSRGQQNNKGMSTPMNNSLLGEYFRQRLGLANGAFVTREDLDRYGRTDVTFYKLDDEMYFMDFSRPEGRN